MSINTCNTYGFAKLSDCALRFAHKYVLNDLEKACRTAREDMDSLDAEDAKDRVESEYYRPGMRDCQRQNILERLAPYFEEAEESGKIRQELFAENEYVFRSQENLKALGKRPSSR